MGSGDRVRPRGAGADPREGLARPPRHRRRPLVRPHVALPLVATLLSAFGELGATASLLRTSRADSLVEPLTERELAVLRLLVAGLSNAAMAQELVITVGTVKRHVNSIYTKLGVNSRTQAVAHAHTLHVL